MNSNKIKDYRCLLLNADFTPLKVVNWQRSIIWSLRSDTMCPIEIIEFYQDKFIQGPNKKYPIPLIAKTKKFYNLYNKPINFSRKNVYIRDDYTCQYCGQKFIISELTYDHVIPKSKFNGKRHACTNWQNIVTSCIKCNAKKADKTPYEANMKLIKTPIQPRYSIDYLPWYRDLTTIDSTNDDFYRACSTYLK